MLELNEGGLPILNYLKIFFRRKEVLIIPSFIGLVFGICTGLLLPKEYTSSSTMLVEEGKTDNPLFDRLAVSTTVSQRMTTIRESILGWNSLTELVKRLRLDADVKDKEGYEQLVDELRDRISIRLKGGNIIELSFMGRDPQMTQAVVQNILDIFVGRNVAAQNKETEDAIKFIEEQLKIYKGKIKSAEIVALQDQLKALFVDSTDKHPDVRRLRERIDAKKKELQEEDLEYTENISLGVQTTAPIVDEIKKSLDGLETKSSKTSSNVPASLTPGEEAQDDIYKVMLIDRLDNVMARDVKVNDGIYNMLLQRLETARITQRLQSSKEGTKYTVLDPPRVPLKPAKPNKMVIAFVGLFFGVISGIGLVFGAELLDQSFIDVEEAKEYLGVPLLGAISKITTEDTVRQEAEKEHWLYGLTVVVGVFVIVMTMAVINFIK